MTKRTTTTADKNYFTESITGEATKTNTPTLPVASPAVTVSNETETTAEPYEKSAHKVVIKRYAIKRD